VNEAIKVRMFPGGDKLQVWPSPNSTRCCACWRDLAIKDRSQFLCRSCLQNLPDSERRQLLSTPAADAFGIMATVLATLGVDPKSRMIPRVLSPSSRAGRCKCAKPQVLAQKNLSGGEDFACNKCGLRPSEEMSR
jgi:hypothetical protein